MGEQVEAERQLIESRINLLLKCLQEVEVLRSDTDILRKRVSPRSSPILDLKSVVLITFLVRLL